ncbi:hypothetical protein [Bradyrhizobium ganzhouense]|uniref:hypothetical protein n=1 Tax=Bradyrhizobium ganzhouense TaxID=1179767 RepID=UPI003CF64B2A
MIEAFQCPRPHRVGEQLNLIRVGEPAARFHPTRSNKFNNIKNFAKSATCSCKTLSSQRAGDLQARLQGVQLGALHEGHRQGDARDDQSADRHRRVAVQPGDIVSADDDGVMIVPKATRAAVVKIAAARDGKEAGAMKALLDGGYILELSGMKRLLSANNCTRD